MDKLTSQVNVKMDHQMEQQLIALATIEDVSLGQYIRQLVSEHLQEKKRQYEKMQQAFGPVTLDNLGTRPDTSAGRPEAP